MLFKLLHSEKVQNSMLVTPSGMFMLVRLRHLEKATAPMLVTPLGIVMLFRLLQSQKAQLPMLVTPLLMITDVIFVLYSLHASLEFHSIKSFISPLPEMVRIPALSNVQFKLPQVPLAWMANAASKLSVSFSVVPVFFSSSSTIRSSLESASSTTISLLAIFSLVAFSTASDSSTTASVVSSPSANAIEGNKERQNTTHRNNAKSFLEFFIFFFSFRVID